MLVLTAYMDETGHSSNTDFVGMGGIVAPELSWRKFEEEWAEALKEYGLGWFHMTDYANSAGEFEKFKDAEPKRKEVLARFMGIITATGGMPMGAVVNMHAYNKLREGAKRRIVDPYYLCFDHCAFSSSLMGYGEEEMEQVHTVFAHHPEFSGRASAAWSRVKKTSKYADFMEGHSIGNTRKLLQLQAADTIAYEIGQFFDNLWSHPDRPLRWGYGEIIKMGYRIQEIPWVKYFGENALAAYDVYDIEDELVSEYLRDNL